MKEKAYIPKDVYLKFYDLLEHKLRVRLNLPEGSCSSESLWNMLKVSKPLYKEAAEELFGKSTRSRQYFYRMIEDLKGKDDRIPFDRSLFCNALRFIGYTLPEEVDSFNFDQQLQILGAAYLQEYFKHLNVSIFYKEKQQKHTNASSSNAINSASSTPLFQSLNSSIFISEYTQGSRVDRAYFTFNTEGQEKITGKMLVNYQGEDDSYLHPDCIDLLSELDIDGQFLYEDVLLFTFVNSKDRITKRHAGVMKLEYTGPDKFSGKYLVKYFKSPPEKRLNETHGIHDLGDIETRRCASIDDARLFVVFQDDVTKQQKPDLKFRKEELY